MNPKKSFALAAVYVAMSLSMLQAASADLIAFNSESGSSPEKNRTIAKTLLEKYGSKFSVLFKNPKAVSRAETEKGLTRSFEADGHRYVYSEEFLQGVKTIMISYYDDDMNGSLDEVVVRENGQVTFEADLNNGAGKEQPNANRIVDQFGGVPLSHISDPFQGNNKGDKLQSDADSMFGSGLELIKNAKESAEFHKAVASN